MNAVIQEENGCTPSDLCTVVGLYEDDTTRTRALAAGHYLINQFWDDVELKFHWWRTDFLKDPGLAEVAACQARESDFLIVCFTDPTEVSPTLEAWFERWISQRKDREGALVDLSLAPSPVLRVSGRESILREIAGRGGFDYLTATQTSPPAGGPRPTDPHAVNTSTSLNNITDRSRPPSHFGLNE